MSDVIFKDNSKAWLAVQEQNLSNAITAMADGVMKNAMIRVPKKKNTLKNSARVNKVNAYTREIIFGGKGVKYAMYQERGERADGTHKVRNYTTPNTGKHYLQDAGENAVRKGLKAFII